jgi:hypothetical protein
MSAQVENFETQDDDEGDLTNEELAMLLISRRTSPGQVALYVVMAVAIVGVFVLGAYALLSYNGA